MKVMYVDESGDHSLKKIDSTYPVFVLAGAILEREYATGELRQQLDAIKQRFFGTTKIVLHRADIARAKNGFERLTDKAFRQDFFAALNKWVSSTPFRMVACVIRKDQHLVRYGSSAQDPYALSFEVLAERFCFDLKREPEQGFIVPERRAPHLDRRLMLAFLRFKMNGTHYAKPQDIGRIAGLALRDKKDNVAGLQLVDLLASSVGRMLLNKKDFLDGGMLLSKYRRHPNGGHLGHGLIILPKNVG
jgi:hypothetical protein